MSSTECRSGLKATVAIGAAVHACTASSGQPVGEPAIDKSIYHLFNPTPRGLLRDLSTDRPDMTESPYTVDAGRFQIEMSFADFTYDRENGETQTVRGLSAAPMLLLQLAFFASTVLPTGANLPLRSGLRSPDQATSYTRSCVSPFASSQPLTIWMRSSLPLNASRAAATRKVGALPADAAGRSLPIGTPRE